PQWRTEQSIALNTLITARAAGDDSLKLEDLLLPYKADDEAEAEAEYDNENDMDDDELIAIYAPF
ncbi:MAG: hypothetical protein M3Z51_07505, partial [Snodgrassella alvi]|nr:hypothetical protein [Snodgrassella alvi]